MIGKIVTICGKEYRSISEVSRKLNISHTIVRSRLSSIHFPDWVCDCIEKKGSVLSNKYETWAKRDNRWEKL